MWAAISCTSPAVVQAQPVAPLLWPKVGWAVHRSTGASYNPILRRRPRCVSTIAPDLAGARVDLPPERARRSPGRTAPHWNTAHASVHPPFWTDTAARFRNVENRHATRTAGARHPADR